MKRLAILLILLTAGAMPATGEPRARIDWLATFEVAPGGTVGVWALVDSFDLWPSAFAASGDECYADGSYMFEHKGDYVRAIVYLDEGSRVYLDDATRVVFAYGDREISTVEIIAPTAARDAVKSSSRGLHIAEGSGLMRSQTGGFRVYLRFAPGILPRPARWFGFGGNRYGVARPDKGYVERGAEDETFSRHDPARRPRALDAFVGARN